MHKRPDLLDGDDEIVVVRMGGIDPERVGSVLNRLSQGLTTTGRVGTGGLVYEEINSGCSPWSRPTPRAPARFSARSWVCDQRGEGNGGGAPSGRAPIP